MAKQLFAAASLLGFAIAASGQDSPLDKLKKEVADLRVQLAIKELELSKHQPAKDVKILRPFGLEVGEAGQLVGLFPVGNGQFSEAPTYVQVEKVIDDRKLLAVVGAPPASPTVKRATIILANYPTAGIAEGKVLDKLGQLLVTGTEKIDGRTLYVLEPYTPAKK